MNERYLWPPRCTMELYLVNTEGELIEPAIYEEDAHNRSLDLALCLRTFCSQFDDLEKSSVIYSVSSLSRQAIWSRWDESTCRRVDFVVLADLGYDFGPIRIMRQTPLGGPCGMSFSWLIHLNQNTEDV